MLMFVAAHLNLLLCRGVAVISYCCWIMKGQYLHSSLRLILSNEPVILFYADAQQSLDLTGDPAHCFCANIYVFEYVSGTKKQVIVFLVYAHLVQ